MSKLEATEEYEKALKEGLKEQKECLQKGLLPHPLVLDDILDSDMVENSINIGLVDIPIERIVGTKSAGRITAFSPGFLPVLNLYTEFAQKWCALCQSHLGTAGIREPIECFEYLGNFYIQEGNKRVSVLKHFGAARIPGIVRRIMPVQDDSPRVKAYNEFLEFYKRTGIYNIQFTQPGQYAKLMRILGITAETKWDETHRRRFRAYLQYFTEALRRVGGEKAAPPVEEALLLWLQMYPFSALGTFTAPELEKTVAQLWKNMLSTSISEPLVKTEHTQSKGSLMTIIKSLDHLNVAFVHQNGWETSTWTQAHEDGRKYLEKALGKSVTTRSYFDAYTPEKADALLEQAIQDGADVVFTTSAPLIGPAMRASVNHPRVRFLNCSVCQHYSSVPTYYSRIYEGKFITGAIAGAMCKDNRIGYVGSYPIYGVPASINAFALGVQFTNPYAHIELKWSCLPGNPTQEFLEDGVRMISNRDQPAGTHSFTEYGTYMADDDGTLIPLGSPRWLWGPFYEKIVRSILNGTLEKEKTDHAVNYWWGMGSGVIDVTLSDTLPDGIRQMANSLKDQLRDGTLDPFARKILDQNGILRNDGQRSLSAAELLHMDWLCQNVHGSIPAYGDVLPMSRTLVNLLGIYPESEKEIEI